MTSRVTGSGDASFTRETDLETTQAQRDLAISLDNLGRAAQDLGDWLTARSYYVESVEICRRLAEQLGTPEAQRELGESLLRAYDMADRVGDRGAVCRYLSEALKWFELVAQQSPNPRTAEVLDSVRWTLAESGCERASTQAVASFWSSESTVVGRLLNHLRRWTTRRR